MTRLIVHGAKWTICSQMLSIKEQQYVTEGHEKRHKDLQMPPGSRAATVYMYMQFQSTSIQQSILAVSEMNMSEENQSVKSRKSNEPFDGF